MSSFEGHAAPVSPTGIAGAIALPANSVGVRLPWDTSSLHHGCPAGGR